MNLTEIRYTYSRFASTNPPQNISNTLDLRIRQNKYELEKADYRNGLTETKIFAVPKEKFEEFSRMFEALDILGAVSADFASAAAEPSVSQTVGGGENHAITFIAGKISIACFYLPDAAKPIVAKLGMLADECGDPVFENTTGADMNSKDYDPVAAAMATVAKIEAMKKGTAASAPPSTGNSSHSDGEWFCTECGHKNSNSKFCTECGTKRI